MEATRSMSTERKTFTRITKRTLSETETAQLAVVHCTILNEIDVLKLERSATAKRLQEDIESKEGVARDLRKRIQMSEVEEQIECYEVPNVDRFEVQIFRSADDVLLDTRAMDTDERRAAMNPTLPLLDDAPVDNVIPLRQVEHSHPPSEDGSLVDGCVACYQQSDAPIAVDDGDAGIVDELAPDAFDVPTASETEVVTEPEASEEPADAVEETATRKRRKSKADPGIGF